MLDAAACRSAAAERSAAEANLARAKTDYDEFARLREQSVNLAQQLREIANAILQDSAEPEECPLCHTRFEPDQLAKHMSEGTDRHIEERAQTLLGQVRQHELLLRQAAGAEKAIAWLTQFSKRANLSNGHSIRATLQLIEQSRKGLGNAQERLTVLNRFIEELESQGLSIAKYDKAAARLTIRPRIYSRVPQSH